MADKKVPNLKAKYASEVAPALMKQFGYKSVMQIPKIDKVVVNVGCGEAKENVKILDNVVRDLAQITGQKPIITRSRKNIANFKLRENMPIGAKVTLRGEKMWEFLDRLFNVALPRVRDFQGISPNAFDGRGNYALGRSSMIKSTRSGAWTWSSAPPRTPTKRPAPCSPRSARPSPAKEGEKNG